MTSSGESRRASQLLTIDVRHDGANLAAVNHRRDGAVDAHEHVADFVSPHVIENRLVLRSVGLSTATMQTGRRARRVERQNDRRSVPGGRFGIGRRGQRVDLRQRPVGIDAATEIIADDARPDDRPRFLPRRSVGLPDPPLHPVA